MEPRTVTKYTKRWMVGILLCLVFCFTAVTRHTAAATDPLTAAQQRATALGAYSFTADIEQTLRPLPIPANMGQTDSRQDMRLSGAVDGDYAEITFRPEAGADLPAFTIIQEGAQTYLRHDGEETAVDNPTAAALPDGSGLTYLAAAQDVQPFSDGCPVLYACYTFTLDGPRLAETVRRQMQPDASQPLAPSPLLERMTGNGRVWIDSRGLPVRQEINTRLPQATTTHDAHLRLIISFTYPNTKTGLFDGTAGPNIGTFTAPRVSAAFSTLLPLLPFLFVAALCATAVFLLYQRRRTRQLAYNLIALPIVFIMLVLPTLQTAVYAHAQSRQASLPSLNEALTGQPDTPQTSISNPQSPVLAQPAALNAANTQSVPTCGTGDANTDSDDDGFNDRDENCYGTDPFASDSDRDIITDTVELEGFMFDGRLWPSNPVQLDSNGDGLADTSEWPQPIGTAPNNDDTIDDADWDPDGDGVPNLWDDDNDGDTVRDDIDLSPFYATAYDDSARLTVDRAGYTGTTTIDLQVQPQNPDHLRYATTPLDWPHDEKGPVQDRDDSNEDIQLTPFLKIRTAQVPADSLMADYGLSAFCEEGADTCDLYAPLHPTGDGGQIVAFQTTLAYGPDAAEVIEWDDVRIVWMVTLYNDYNRENQPELFHTYDGSSFRLSGMHIGKNGRYHSGIFGFNPDQATDTDSFNLLFGLSLSFLHNQNPDLAELDTRFNSPNTALHLTWGVPADHVNIDTVTYDYSDPAVAAVAGRATDLLQTQNHAADSRPVLLLAGEETSGAFVPDYTQTPTGLNLAVNMADIGVDLQRSLRLVMYEQGDDGWQALNWEETITAVDDQYADLTPALAELSADYPDLTEADLRSALYLYFTVWTTGMIRILATDGTTIAPDGRNDTDITNILYQPDIATLPAYIFAATGLGQPGGGTRVGDLSQAWQYQRENDDAGKLGFVSDVANFLFVDNVDEDKLIFTLWSFKKSLSTILAVATALQAVQWVYQAQYFGFTGWTKMTQVSGWTSRMPLNIRTLGVAGLVASVLALTVLLVVATDWSNPISIQAGFAFWGASLIVTAVLFAISLNPIGAALVALFVLVDLILFFATGGEFSLTGKIIGAIADLFFDASELTYLDDVDFDGSQSEMRHPELGMVAGNSLLISDTYVGVIREGDGQGDHEDEALDDSETWAAFHGTADSGVTVIRRNGSNDCSTSGTRKTCTDPVGIEYRFDSPGINIELELSTVIKARTYYEECRFGICDRSTNRLELPADLDKGDRWDPSRFYFDILPATLDGLWTWSAITNPDPDGDGLLTTRENELGTDPHNWDSDGDTLSDQFELDMRDELGTDPLQADSDGDGIDDGIEFRLGTRIDQADSDGDTLSDAAEIYHWNGAAWTGGWLIATLPESSSTGPVFSSPTQADLDNDSLNDASERGNAISPNAANDLPRLTLEASPRYAPPNAANADVYLAPAQTVALTLTLESSGPRPITDTLQLCLPDFLDTISGGQMQGDRQPPLQTSGNCLSWTFSHEHTLQIWETVSTTVQATAVTTPTNSATISATLPYHLANETRDVTAAEAVILDNDTPEVVIAAPAAGEIIGGGVSSYVMGGTAVDDGSWIADVQLTLSNGSATASGRGTWAYTWDLPADGTYTLSASATDRVGSIGPTDSVQVVVDNTPPNVFLDLADGAVVGGSASNVITVTLSGSASDNLTGLTRIQISTDNRPWREVWAAGGTPTNANWQTDWVLPNQTSAQGAHSVRVRATDNAGNTSPVLERTVIVDVVPPTDALTDNRFTADDPPHVPGDQTLLLEGVANDAGRLPDAPNPADLNGALHSLDDATVWLTGVNGEDATAVTWIGDFNGDRLADAAIGLPAAENGNGRVTILYGRTGGWELPPHGNAIADSLSNLIGADGAGLGDQLAPAGDVNRDGYADLLIGDTAHNRAFLILGQTGYLGRSQTLDDGSAAIWEITPPATMTLTQFAAAGDANGDGYDDLLVAAHDGSDTTSYLLLGRDTAWRGLEIDAAATVETAGTAVSLSAVGDRDGDENGEFAVAANNTVYVFAGDTAFAPGLGSPTPLDLAGATTFGSSDAAPAMLPAGDVDGDNHPDFLFDNGSSPTLSFANGGSHSFAGHDGFLAAPGDVNGDGRNDILLGSGGDAYLYLGGSLGAVQATITAVSSAASAPNTGTADLNSDGSDDLLTIPATTQTTLNSSQSTGASNQTDLSAETPPLTIHNSQFIIHYSTPLAANVPDALFVDDDAICDGNLPCYATIQTAVNAADGGGDTITVYPGVYAPFEIAGSSNISLTLRGVHANAVFIDGGGADTAVTITNTRAISLSQLTIRNAVSGVTIGHAGENGWQNDAERITLDHLLIHDVSAHAITTDRFSSVRVQHSTLATPSQDDASATIFVAGPEVYPSAWSEAASDGRFASDGGMFSDDQKLYIYPHDSIGGDIEVYNPGTGSWETAVPAPPDAACTNHIAGMDIDENGDIWAICRAADNSGSLFRYSGGSWSGVLNTLPDNFTQPVGHLHAVGDGRLYILRGNNNGASAFDGYLYNIAGNSWGDSDHTLPGVGAGTVGLTAAGLQFVLAGGNRTDWQRFDNSNNSYLPLEPTPLSVGAGAGLAWDGRDYYYLLPGGLSDRLFVYDTWLENYNLSPWRELAALPDAAVMREGGALLRVDDTLYALPGGSDGRLFAYDPVGPTTYRSNTLVLENNAFVHPDDSGTLHWLALAEDMFTYWPQQPKDFDVSGSDNTWVGGTIDVFGDDRFPDPDYYAQNPFSGNLLITTDEADFINPANGVYRPGPASTLTGGYETGYTAELTVAADGSGDTLSIQAAIDAGARRIVVQPGIYAESVTLWSDVVVESAGSADEVIVQPPGHSVAALFNVEGVRDVAIRGLMLDGNGQSVDGLHVNDDAQLVTFSRSLVQGTATAVSLSGPNTDVELFHNTLVSNTHGVNAADCAPLDLRNSILAGHSGTALAYEGCAATQLHTYNLYWQNGIDQNPATVGVGELYQDPLFVDPVGGNFHLSAASPALDAANPSDPAPDARADIGYVEFAGGNTYHVDDDYCATCANDGLTWGVDAFNDIQDALDAAAADLAAIDNLGYPDGPLRTVYVHAGFYDLGDPALQMGSYVRLEGESADTVTIQGTLDLYAATHSTVANLGFFGSGETRRCIILLDDWTQDVTITRNVFSSINRDRWHNGICLYDQATADIQFNTFFDLYRGVEFFSDTSTAVIANNIFSYNTLHIFAPYGAHTVRHVSIDYNIFHFYRDAFSYDPDNLEFGEGNLFPLNTAPLFVNGHGGNYQLVADTVAIDAADPEANVPPGGGPRADLGAFEYAAGGATVHVSLLLGQQDVSTAVANAGVAAVELGVVPVPDPATPITATEPTAWSAVTLDSPNATVSGWTSPFDPAADGLHRVYSRAEDAAGNREDDDWYDGAFIADSVAPTLTWLAPTAASSGPAPLELRAEVSDYVLDRFSVDEIYFRVNGSRIDADWALTDWDEAVQQPRVFRAWVSLADGEHTATAVATDLAGNTAETTPITFTVSGQNPADVLSPTLTLTTPVAGDHYSRTLPFAGTVADAGSGLAALQLSLDGGHSWAAIAPDSFDGLNWTYTLTNTDAALALYNYNIAVRAVDNAGNTAVVGPFITAIDNRPPTPPNVDRFESKYQYATFSTPIDPGQHRDMAPEQVTVYFNEMFDPSGVGTLLNWDTISNTIPTGSADGYPYGEEEMIWATPGNWYVHLGAQDTLSQSIVHHYGPFHVGSIVRYDPESLVFPPPIIPLPVPSRIQSIIMDGLLDTDMDEWRTDWELLDDGEDGDSRQELYFTVDATAVYLGWRGSWWDTDGTLWAYLDSGGASSSDQPVASGDPTLPFAADIAIEVLGPDNGRVWQYGGALGWQETAVIPLTVIQDDSGDTEIKLNLALGSASELKLFVYAAADSGDIWRVFPTSNPADGPWSDAYIWSDLQNTVDFNEVQPTGDSVQLAVASPQAAAAHGRNAALDLVYTLTNYEDHAVSGLQLDLTTSSAFTLGSLSGGTCSTCDPAHYVIDVPDLPTTSTHTITVTGQLAADLSAVTAVSHTATLSSTPPRTAVFSHRTDGLPPEVDVLLRPANVIGDGLQTVHGTAVDNASGVALVEYRLNSGAWQPATGTTNWSATINAAGADVLLEARATDHAGLTSVPTATTYVLDTTPPTLTLSLPLTLTGQYAEFGGLVADSGAPGAQVAYVEFQVGGSDAPWQRAVVFPGSQTWHAAWHLPYVDVAAQQIRARAVDWAGNVSDPLPWQNAVIDTVPPELEASQLLTRLFQNAEVAASVLSGVVQDNSGIASAVVWLYDPTGAAYTDTLSIEPTTGAWYYQPDFSSRPLGRYGLWVEATDTSGNTIHFGPYWLELRDSSATVYADPDGVCEGNTPCYTSLATAVADADPGYQVIAYGSVYTQSVTLDKDVSVTAVEPLTLIGSLLVQDGAFIAPDGTLAVQGDFTHSGGDFSHNNGRILFNGGAQAVTSNAAFNDLTVGDGSTLSVGAGVQVDGQLVLEPGVTTVEETVVSGVGRLDFAFAGLTLDVAQPGLLTTLTVTRTEAAHPQAGSGIDGGRYWQIMPNPGANGSFSAALTLPHDNHPDPAACRYSDGSWDCVQSVFNANSVTRAGITAFSDWAVGEKPNAPPQAVADSAEMDEDTAVTIDVLANDSDAENDPLAITAVGAASHGSLSYGAVVTYTPALNFNGSDVFTYTVGDDQGGWDTAVVTVTVQPVNDPPLAVADVAETDNETAVVIDVLANDSDVDLDGLILVSVSGAGLGTVVINNGAIVYTPTVDLTGEDIFTYTISDGVLTAVAQVTVTVKPAGTWLYLPIVFKQNTP